MWVRTSLGQDELVGRAVFAKAVSEVELLDTDKVEVDIVVEDPCYQVIFL